MQLMNTDLLGTTGLAGFRTGMSDDRALEMSNRDLLSRDLSNESQQLKNQDYKDNTPLRAVERALKLAEAEKLQTEMTQGMWEEDRARKRNTEKANLAKQLNENQLFELKQRIAGMEAVGMILGDEANPVSLSANWDAAREAAKQYKFDIGEYSQENLAKILRMKQQTPLAQKLYMDNINHRQALELKDKDMENWQNRLSITGGNQRANTKIIQDAMTARAAAAAAAKAAGGGVGAYKPSDEFEAAWQRYRAGERDDDTLDLAEAFMRKTASAGYDKNVQLKLDQLEDELYDPNTSEKRKEEIRARRAAIQEDEIRSRFGSAWDRLKQRRGGGGSKPSGKTGGVKGTLPDGRRVIRYPDGTGRVLSDGEEE